MNQSESLKELASALALAQGELGAAIKDTQGQIGKQLYQYADLSNVIGAIKAVAPKHGLSYVQGPVSSSSYVGEEHRETDGDGVTKSTVRRAPVFVGVETMLMHISGEWIQFEPIYFPLNQQTAQGAGSAITYARRYALAAIFGVTAEDDDGAESGRGSWGLGHEEAPRSGPPRQQRATESGNIMGLMNEFKVIAADLGPAIGHDVTGATLMTSVQEWVAANEGKTPRDLIEQAASLKLAAKAARSAAREGGQDA